MNSPAPSGDGQRERQPAARAAAAAVAASLGAVRRRRRPRSAREGQRAGERDERQQAEEDVAASRPTRRRSPAIAGPMTPGRTHAVESVANIRGRSDSGRRPADGDVGDRLDRPGAEPLDEAGGDEDRHRRREAADQQADREQPEPDARTAAPARRGRSRRRRRRCRSASRGRTREKTQPYSSRPPSSRATIGMTVETASASNADQRDRQHEPDRQGPAVGAPQAVGGVAPGQVHGQRMAGMGALCHGRPSCPEQTFVAVVRLGRPQSGWIGSTHSARQAGASNGWAQYVTSRMIRPSCSRYMVTMFQVNPSG